MGLVDLEPCGILFPQSGVEHGSPELQGVFLTTGPPGKSLNLFFSAVIKTFNEHKYMTDIIDS